MKNQNICFQLSVQFTEDVPTSAHRCGKFYGDGVAQLWTRYVVTKCNNKILFI